MKDIMLDLETLATNDNACITSIGAVKFNLETGELGEEFYVNISAKSCTKYGLEIDGETVMWWMSQSKEARDALTKDPQALDKALSDFSKFYGNFRKSRVWGNGSVFDNVILRNAYRAISKTEPWGFRDDRDVRTLVQLGKSFGMERTETVREGTHHNALDDAKHQARYCSEIYKHIKGAGTSE